MIFGKRYQTQKRLKKESQVISTKVPTSVKVKGRHVFHLIYSMHALCLLKDNYHGFCPQWLCIFILQRIYTVFSQRELSQILPSVALYFHPSEDLHRVSSERTFTDFALNSLAFSSLRGFIPCLLRENCHELCPQWLYIFIPQRIYTVSPQRELSWIFPSMAFHFHPSED